MKFICWKRSSRSGIVNPLSWRDCSARASHSWRQWSRQTSYSSGLRKTCGCIKSEICHQRNAAWNPSWEFSNVLFNDWWLTKYMRLWCRTPLNCLQAHLWSVATLSQPVAYLASGAPPNQPLACLEALASLSYHLTFRHMKANETWAMLLSFFLLWNDTSQIQWRLLDGSARCTRESNQCDSWNVAQQ